MTMYQRPLRPDELMHYGVKGMKWGVRRYQNPDGTLTSAGKSRRKYQNETRPINENPDSDTYTLKRGTKMYRMSGSSTEEGPGRKYASFLSDDRETYNSSFNGLSLDSKYEHTLIAADNLKVAKGRTVLKELMKYNGDKRLKDITCIKEDIDTFSYIYNKGISVCFTSNDKKDFLKKMSKKYDVIVDLEDLYSKAMQPIIILNDKKVKTKSIRSVNE